jgi:hypothetical protein
MITFYVFWCAYDGCWELDVEEDFLVQEKEERKRITRALSFANHTHASI